MIHEATSTTELAFAQKFLEAFKAYGLTPAEVGATIALISTVGHSRDEANSDGLRLHIVSHKVVDPERAEFVKQTVAQFIDDFIQATGLNTEALGKHYPYEEKPLCQRGNTASGGESFYCYNMAECSKWGGENRTFNDVWNGLDQMITAKGKWTQRAA